MSVICLCARAECSNCSATFSQFHTYSWYTMCTEDPHVYFHGQQKSIFSNANSTHDQFTYSSAYRKICFWSVCLGKCDFFHALSGRVLYPTVDVHIHGHEQGLQQMIYAIATSPLYSLLGCPKPVVGCSVRYHIHHPLKASLHVLQFVFLLISGDNSRSQKR